MRKARLIIGIIGLLAVIFITTPPAAAEPAQQDQNLLRNPGFEGEFFAWSGIPEVQVAHEWTPWWIEDTERDPRWHRPEWKRALSRDFSNRVKSGESAQQWFTFYASHYAGMYQQVPGVTPGQTYRFSVWVQVWSSLEDDANTSVLPANPRFQVGIEPNGDARPGFAWSPSAVIWSGEASMDAVIDGWALISVETVAQSDTITVYMRTNPDFANKHNDIYIDDASLIRVSGAPAAPQPTAAPVVSATEIPPTAAPTTAPPTATSVPPTSTATREPTATATETAIPTEEPPTQTPEPTATELPPTATATDVPPTATAEPGPTLTSEPEPEPEETAIAAVPEDDNSDGSEVTEAEVEAAEPTPQSGTPIWVWVLIALAFMGLGAWGFQRGR